MLYYIYIPDDVPKRCRRMSECVLVGFEIDNCLVAVDVCPPGVNLEKADSQLRIIGRINSSLKTDLEFRIDEQTQLLYVDDQSHTGDKFSIVFFSPPNLRNLEYFTVKPIFLQSTGKEFRDRSLIGKMEVCHQIQGTDPCPQSSSESDAVFDKINQCLKLRELLSKKQEKQKKQTHRLPPRRALARTILAWYEVLVAAIMNYMIIMTQVIKVLNSEVRGFVPVTTSAWCKQLDLRLRQLSYLPIQFMCYYGPGVPEDIKKMLDSPPANKRLNFNNSNYINLYNSVWLIFNDVLLGRTCYYFLMNNKDLVFHLVNNVILKAHLFAKLENLIKWVGLYHPAGFKLNNDLGSFMQSMFIWTSQSWTACFEKFVCLLEADSWFSTIFALWFRVTCSCGFSFIIAASIDYLKLFNSHIYFFNIATTKIYNRQVEMLKSLVQLFRGKKYNILRNRVDLIEESEFRIDQLLLGTFCFMILLYLLPTTFAFYILFFLSRLTILTFLKLGDKVILSFNLYPLFVVLLKLKNSKRLQGGVHFKYLGTHSRTDWYKMENKALTFDEIYGSFYKVFRQEGQYVRLFMNLLEGRELQLRDTASMKKNYLMLPRNYFSVVRVWLQLNPGAHLIIRGELKEYSLGDYK